LEANLTITYEEEEKEEGWQEVVVNEVRKGTYKSGKPKTYSSKFPRQYPLSLLVIVGCLQGRTFGSEGCKAMGSGSSKHVNTGKKSGIWAKFLTF